MPHTKYHFKKQKNHFQLQKKRSIVKSITFTLIGAGLDFVAVYVFTKNLEISLGATILSNFLATVAYYFHERIWNKTQWGRDFK
ncbi:MAG TPA: DUF2061 domain-containing protein [archaeon]|nr:DUF2061 domain-containing protein [archaeon]